MTAEPIPVDDALSRLAAQYPEIKAGAELRVERSEYYSRDSLGWDLFLGAAILQELRAIREALEHTKELEA